MESDSDRLCLERAKRKDIKEIAELLYITEPEPEEEWGFGTEKERKATLRRLMRTGDNRFSIQNIIVARKKGRLVGMLLYLEGKKISKLTIKSEKNVVKIQQGFLNKLGFIYSSIKGHLFYKECEKDEFYISNIAIKPEHRGNGYAQIMIQKAYELAHKKGYKKAALVAKNNKLIKFYEKLGFYVVDSELRRMAIEI